MVEDHRSNLGNAGHGKGEVDHVGGVAKVAARRAIAGIIVSFCSNHYCTNWTVVLTSVICSFVLYYRLVSHRIINHHSALT